MAAAIAAQSASILMWFGSHPFRCFGPKMETITRVALAQEGSDVEGIGPESVPSSGASVIVNRYLGRWRWGLARARRVRATSMVLFVAAFFVMATLGSTRMRQRVPAVAAARYGAETVVQLGEEPKGVGKDSCIAYGENPYGSDGKYTSCCGKNVSCHLKQGGGEWEKCYEYHTMCVERCSAAGLPAARPPAGGGKSYRLQSFNVWYGNHNYAAIAEMISSHVNPDIVAIQEAVASCKGGGGQAMIDAIVKALNAQVNPHTKPSSPEWKVANPWHHGWYWCGLHIYRSDLWDLDWHYEFSLKQNRDTRGVCGARFRRKADSLAICSWGAHPAWQPATSGKDAEPKWTKDAIRQVAELMQKCSAESGGAHSVFMGDMNSPNSEPIRLQLESSTGWKWKLAFGYGYDQIFVQQPQHPSGGTALCRIGQPGCSLQAGCGKNCSHPAWAYSDHPPVFVDVSQ